MSTKLPRIDQREMQFAAGTAIGLSQRWGSGGNVAPFKRPRVSSVREFTTCNTPAEFGQAIAIARGTPV